MLNNVRKSDQTLHNLQIQDDDELDLGELFATLYHNKWLILAVTTIALLIGFAKAFLDTPIYKADALLQVEESSRHLEALDPVAGILETKSPVQTEIEIIKSRMILGKAVNNLKLDIVAEPKYFPLIGQAIARRFQRRNQGAVSAPLLGYSDYAWGGEQIKVDTLSLPESWKGKNMTLITGQNGSFKVIDDNNELLAEGKVGKFIDQPVEGDEFSFRMLVSLLKARPGTHFIVRKQSQLNAISTLQQQLSVREKGKGTGILSFNFESSSPLLAMQILNEIADIYVQMNVEQKSAEAQKTLEFLHKQLPIIKDQLEAATSALNQYRLRRGSVDLSLETQSILEGVVEKRTQITLLQQKREELRRRFTPSHPAVVANDKQISRLRVQLEALSKKIKELPKTQQVILRLSRDVQVNTELYTTLLNNLQTLKVAKAGTVGDVRIVDYAVLPTYPVKPKKTQIVAVSLILGLIAGIGLVMLRRALHHGVEDPDIIEKHLNVPVYATIPHSDAQEKLNTQLKQPKSKTVSEETASSRSELQKMLGDQLKKNSSNTESQADLAVLALENNEDLAIESLRSLRTTLHFAFLEAKNNIIMITGPSPGVGKTFVSTNLAIVLASSGKRILLIDADLRKGVINQALGVSRDKGLSDLISNTISPIEAIHHIPDANIDFIPTGTIPPNPSELLLQERFGMLLESLGEEYDQIIIDSPPILAVTDACIIGRMASATLMVVKAGVHPLRELQQAVKRLQQNDVDIKGVVFNDLRATSSRYGYGYGYGYGGYVYQYNYQKS